MRLVPLIVVLVSVAVISAVSFTDISNAEWEAFKLEHGKNYSDETEELFRLRIFNDNKYKIEKHNQLYAAGKASYKLALNKYADMLHHEVMQTMTGYNPTQRKLLRANDLAGKKFVPPANLELPHSVDWRQKGAVTPVKDQGNCGSCWAFSTTGSVEGQHFLKSGKLTSLSEQNLVDCSVKDGNAGCSGGEMDLAFRYIKENHGIDTEKSYPYKGVNGTCHFHRRTVGATVKGFVDIPEGDEIKLQQAVATKGPVSVAIDVSLWFQFYFGGVFYDPFCSNGSNDLNHGVLVVGYGTEDGQDYWLVKNSWGAHWGENGYIKMSRNKNNQCGIATTASYPLV